MRESVAVRRLRMIAAIVLIVLYAGAAAVPRLRSTASVILRGRAVDAVGAEEARFAPLRQILGQSVVGYLSDPPREGVTRAESRLDYRRFVVTQYALAPSLVRRSADEDLVVGYFHDVANADTARVLGLSLVRDFGNGVMLFRRAP